MFFFFNKIIRITQFSKLATNCSSASPNTMIDRKCKSSISLTVDNLLHSLVRRRTKNFCNNTRNAGHDKAERSKKSWRLVEKGSDDYWNDARDSNSSPPRGVLKKKKKKKYDENRNFIPRSPFSRVGNHWMVARGRTNAPLFVPSLRIFGHALLYARARVCVKRSWCAHKSRPTICIVTHLPRGYVPVIRAATAAILPSFVRVSLSFSLLVSRSAAIICRWFDNSARRSKIN